MCFLPLYKKISEFRSWRMSINPITFVLIFKRRMIGLIDMKEESGPKKSRYSYTPTFWPVVLYLWPKLHRCNKCKKCHKLYRRLYFLVKINSSPCLIEAALPFEGFMFFVFNILWSVTNTKYFYFWPCLLFCLVLSPSLFQSSVLLGWGYGYG